MSLAILLALALPAAHAVIYGGNPNLTITVDHADLDTGYADLTSVRLTSCGGGVTTVSVNDTFDPAEGLTVAIPAGNYCAVTLTWGDVMELEGSSPAGSWTAEYDSATTFVPLATPISPVTLSPLDVTSGVIYGGNPNLRLFIQ